MANTYTWDCKTVDVYPTHDGHSDVVYTVHWRLNAESDQQDAEGNNYSASVYGTHSVNADDISDFIPFANLTNEIVTGWVTDGMGEEEVASLKSVLDAKIADEINPTSVVKTLES
jgi:hypothetical protein